MQKPKRSLPKSSLPKKGKDSSSPHKKRELTPEELAEEYVFFDKERDELYEGAEEDFDDD